MMVNVKLERMWKEAKFKVLSWNYLGGTEEKHEEHQSR
jgi:hypothetical protein